MNRSNGNMKNSRGFTLLEALLGFLILSIGMLGIASLQAVSLKSGKTAVYGSVAMMKVDELFESMRANNTGAALAMYQAVGDSPGTNNLCSAGTTCSDVQLAQDDVYWWQQNLTAGMPGAATAGAVKTSISLIPAVAPSKMASVTINVSWQERDKDKKGGVARTYSTTSGICTGIPC